MTLHELLKKQGGTTQVKLIVQDDPNYRVPLFTTYILNYRGIKNAEVVTYRIEAEKRNVYVDSEHEYGTAELIFRIIYVTVRTLKGV